ncbi:hypothetical protein [Sinorhizobium fredii]|uniref:hypothetical protein n=1 Tax=Rhizobium fredii TaxID=380 RepID=UPI0005B51030|nr:hypothetical protein [Sinorhizobium fredii]
MQTFWITFRLKDNATYTQRYDDLVETVRTSASKWWVEPSSFLVFASSETIDTIAARVKKVINTADDLVVIGMSDYKSARLVGNNEDADIFDLIPFMKRA